MSSKNLTIAKKNPSLAESLRLEVVPCRHPWKRQTNSHGVSELVYHPRFEQLVDVRELSLWPGQRGMCYLTGADDAIGVRHFAAVIEDVSEEDQDVGRGREDRSERDEGVQEQEQRSVRPPESDDDDLEVSSVDEEDEDADDPEDEDADDGDPDSLLPDEEDEDADADPPDVDIPQGRIIAVLSAYESSNAPLPDEIQFIFRRFAVLPEFRRRRWRGLTSSRGGVAEWLLKHAEDFIITQNFADELNGAGNLRFVVDALEDGTHLWKRNGYSWQGDRFRKYCINAMEDRWYVRMVKRVRGQVRGRAFGRGGDFGKDSGGVEERTVEGASGDGGTEGDEGSEAS